MDKEEKAPVLEFWLTREQWVQFIRVMELCDRVAGGPVGPADCLALMCRSYLERRRTVSRADGAHVAPAHLQSGTMGRKSRSQASSSSARVLSRGQGM